MFFSPSYSNSPWGCDIRLGLLIVDHDAKYCLRGDVIEISLFAYLDALVCRLAIIAVGIPYGYPYNQSVAYSLGGNKA